MAPRLFACFAGGREVASSSSSPPEAKATADLTAEEQRRMGPVLVELFSSQGCATSPDAEEVVSRICSGELRRGDLPPVALLEFHVEYWDYRGWRDPFGSSLWTVRQKAYVETLRLDTLYTPQVVVNGRAQCVGTDVDAICAAIQSAPRFPSPTMQMKLNRTADGTALQVSLSGALGTRVDGGGADVMVALYESGLVTECAQGENRGRVLTNDFVVRRLEKLSHVKNMSPKKKVSGSVRFALWEGFDAANCGLLVFVQNGSLHTFGIQQLQIPDAI
ncbi:uncharacterized protein LOC122017924 [Zingiber officinale]|uniref:Uncharacterized protein n=1 Tax=Zingiber officinale TaxID=94328 RepID=A0A8J5KM85_ZINOF|nr:uncharacterized protein LOC122008521 [Zingiber officinale]XP_042431579.1 uncharacterized protein LOC122017924 [Zingiber officinale]KAG6482193.1 hypothetical protein ZIOFF_058824 [Zingiber officinale]KAG6486078.1 hypothetical protein ZIOFF_054648 [Zingiber officinale]